MGEPPYFPTVAICRCAMRGLVSYNRSSKVESARSLTLEGVVRRHEQFVDASCVAKPDIDFRRVDVAPCTTFHARLANDHETRLSVWALVWCSRVESVLVQV